MSFSSEVKEELVRQFCSSRHCQIAELAAVLSFCGNSFGQPEDGCNVYIQTENLAVAKKFYQLVRNAFQIKPELLVRKNAGLKKSNTCFVMIRRPKEAFHLMEAVKMLKKDGLHLESAKLVNALVVRNACCKRAFIRGAFLAAGSISDPEKFYHFEIVCTKEEKAVQLKDLIHTFQIDAKIVQRKKYYIVYVKEGSQIVDLLNIMEAHVSLMNLENVRIVKEMRNSVNRQVNCETANINKTVSAAVKQIEDIHYIQDTAGLHVLPEKLEEMARVRLEQPEAALKELGMMLTPPVGKSGVNHRLRKISQYAEEIRENKEEI